VKFGNGCRVLESPREYLERIAREGLAEAGGDFSRQRSETPGSLRGEAATRGAMSGEASTRGEPAASGAGPAPGRGKAPQGR
jgi:hypothetical protein